MNIHNERNPEVDDEETLERGNGGEVDGGEERRQSEEEDEVAELEDVKRSCWI